MMDAVRYYVFQGSHYYPLGGIDDFREAVDFPNDDAAGEYLRSLDLGAYEWAAIARFDEDSRRFVPVAER